MTNPIDVLESLHEKAIAEKDTQIAAQAAEIERLRTAVELAIEWSKLDHPGGSFLENKLREALEPKL